MPSVRKVLDDSLGDGQHLRDSSFQKVLDSENHAAAEEAKDKGHYGDAPLRHPQRDTLEIAQGRSRIPKLDTTPLDSTTSPASPAPTGGSMSPFSRTTSDSDKPVRKVLLVDDNRVNLQLLVTYIKKSGHAFMTASNGLEALEAYKSQCGKASDGDAAIDSPFDYVLMDLSMPIMDGLTSTRKIRAHERANNIKPTTVIALTGLASAQAQQEAYSSGIDTFMTKPVKLKELGKMLDAGTLSNLGIEKNEQKNQKSTNELGKSDDRKDKSDDRKDKTDDKKGKSDDKKK
ncbi:hypothetical protein KCU77_g17024, partial [Aureobasidium melanogenum]